MRDLSNNRPFDTFSAFALHLAVEGEVSAANFDEPGSAKQLIAETRRAIAGDLKTMHGNSISTA